MLWTKKGNSPQKIVKLFMYRNVSSRNKIDLEQAFGRRLIFDCIKIKLNKNDTFHFPDHITL